MLDWGDGHLRDLPWRRTREPWPILVSEIMLQQTQVDRVVGYWQRFVDRFPAAEACAAAPLGEVLRLWQGLGYPRRAKYLHEAATQLATTEAFPDTVEALMRLRGVGPYTARAVLAFAFEADVAPVDTNVARVYARLLGRSLGRREVQVIADQHVPVGQAWRWNQSLIELGATVCVAATPRCGACPVAEQCGWRGVGDDPAAGSAGVSGPQKRFAGSDREARGQLLRALTDGPVSLESIAAVMGRDPVTAQRVLDGLVVEGLCCVSRAVVNLPG